MDDLTEIYDGTIFRIEPLPIRSYEKDYIVQMDISIEMNLDLATLARSGYTPLDVLSDVGGIQSILISALGIFIGILNYNNFDNFMVSQLFKIQRPPMGRARQDLDPATDGVQAAQLLQPTLFLNTYEWLYDLTPSFTKCRCCRKTRKLREFELARMKLARETSIIEIVRSRRLIYKALELLLPPEKHAELVQNSQYSVVIDDDPKMLESDRVELGKGCDSQRVELARLAQVESSPRDVPDVPSMTERTQNSGASKTLLASSVHPLPQEKQSFAYVSVKTALAGSLSSPPNLQKVAP